MLSFAGHRTRIMILVGLAGGVHTGNEEAYETIVEPINMLFNRHRPNDLFRHDHDGDANQPVCARSCQ